jgi:hypothetical protein
MFGPSRAYARRRKMSQVQYQPGKRSISTRTLALVIIVVGLGAGITAYSIGSALAQANAANRANQLTGDTSSTNPQWYGPGPGPFYRGGFGHPFNGSFTSFRAATTVANVSITGYTITSSTHITLDLAYGGAGSAPALTVVALAPGLSGSNTITSGWGSSTTVSVALQGSGSLSSTSSCIRVLVVPLTGA